MAVSLVWWTGNRSATNGNEGGANYGWIAGKPVTKEAINQAAQEARLQFFARGGSWPGQDSERMGFDLEVEAYKRLFIIQKQEELGIHVSSEQVAKAAADNLRAMSRNGAAVTMSMFDQNVLKPGGVNLGDYERFLRHQLGMQQLIEAVTVSGRLVTEKEARALFVQENQERSAQAVFFSLSNYLAGVQSTPESLTAFYSNQLAQYRLPNRIQVSYVEFKATNFWAEAQAELAKMTNLSSVIEAEYTRRGGTNFYSDITPDKARESIKDELQEQLALRAANIRANEFADPIMSAKEIRAASLGEQAKAQGLALQVTAPFDRSSMPEGLDVTEQFVRTAFALREDEPVGGPIITPDAVYVIARNKEIPSEVPPFEQIKDRVAADYRQFEAIRAARNAASAFVTTATNAVAQGKAFAGACSEAKISPVLLPPFSLSTRSLPEIEDHISLQQFKQIAFGIKVGEVSPAVPTAEGAVVTYVQSELPLDEQKVNAGLPEFIKVIRQTRQQEAFDEWFNREATRALAHTPVMGPRPSELSQPDASK